jgi:hypothetical protein
VIGALQRLVAKGGTFRPSVSELVCEIGADPSRPGFAEACQLIYGQGGVLRARPDALRWQSERERRALYNAAAVGRAEGMHPLIGAFIRAQGIDRLRELPLDDPDWGTKHRADLKREWDDFTARVSDRQAAALAVGGDPLHGLHRHNPLAFLERTAAQITEGTNA